MICCRNIVKTLNKYEIKVGYVKKLIPNLGHKNNYVVHYRNLQLYLSLGMKLTKIHRVFKFKQSEWMKNYIDFNTEKRMNATNDYAAIHEIKPVLILSKPIYIGFTVLDLSKWKMSDFHYNFIKKDFNAE